MCGQSHLYFVVLTHVSLYQRLVLKYVVHAGAITRSCNVSQRCPGLPWRWWSVMLQKRGQQIQDLKSNELVFEGLFFCIRYDSIKQHQLKKQLKSTCKSWNTEYTNTDIWMRNEELQHVHEEKKNDSSLWTFEMSLYFSVTTESDFKFTPPGFVYYCVTMMWACPEMLWPKNIKLPA